MSTTYYKNYIKLGCWNIQGMSEYKTHDSLVLQYIKQHDCVVFIETWLNENISFENYYTYCLPAKKSNWGRSKGGIIVAMKKELKRGIKILQTVDSHILWLKFEKSCFKLMKDMFVCIIYIPPINCVKRENDIFHYWEILEDSILQYSRHNGDIVIIGDLNSRTGTLSDVLEMSPEIDDFTSNLNFDEINTRISKDSVINQYGRRLVDVCTHNELVILNGRVLGDLQGQYTSYHYNGASVIYYCIVTRNLK